MATIRAVCAPWIASRELIDGAHLFLLLGFSGRDPGQGMDFYQSGGFGRMEQHPGVRGAGLTISIEEACRFV